jgi:hypothetical protein
MNKKKDNLPFGVTYTSTSTQLSLFKNCFLCYVVLGSNTRVLCMLGKCSNTELYSQTLSSL